MYLTSEEESPTQVQQRNIREAEMLTSNLGEGYISQQEILSDIGVLKELAILQESMVYNLLFIFQKKRNNQFECFNIYLISGMVFTSHN